MSGRMRAGRGAGRRTETASAAPGKSAWCETTEMPDAGCGKSPAFRRGTGYTQPSATTVSATLSRLSSICSRMTSVVEPE
jgi:hypothetical protein